MQTTKRAPNEHEKEGKHMCNATMNQHMQELAKLRTMRAELDQLITAEEEALKAFMTTNELSELIGEEHKATFKLITSSRIDTTAFKKAFPDIAARFTRSSSSMRFTFA